MNNSNRTTSQRLLSVYSGRECIGFVLPRAKVGFEAFDRDERSRGLWCIRSVGRYPDGRVGELFLNNHKSNSASDASARDAAIVCSLALQNSVPLEPIQHALLRDAQGRPSTPIGTAIDLVIAGDVP